MREFLKSGHTIILLGTGGVGKTTVAAAMGVAGAIKELKTVVITVDPTQRLRDALGLQSLGQRPVQLDPRRLRQAGIHRELKLSAILLDVKGLWDSLVERFIPDRARRERILANRFYRSLAGQFAGSDSYAALEQLYDLRESGSFALEIVDTPPASQAFEFLEAPARLVRLLDSGLARWLFSPNIPGRFALQVASRAARLVIRELERFAGDDVLASISDFFTSAAVATGALADRFRKAGALLHSPSVHFVIVTTAEPDRLRQADQLMAEMKRRNLRPAAVIINRFLDEQTWNELAHNRKPPAAAVLRTTLAGNLEANSGLRLMVGYLEQYSQRQWDDIERVEQFARSLPADVRLRAAPELFVEVANLRTLKRIASYLTEFDAPVDRGLAIPRRSAPKGWTAKKPE